MLIPVTGIIPTYNRVKSLEATLISLSKQDVQFQELIIIDASSDDQTKTICEQKIPNLNSRVEYQRAVVKGAAAQRNEGVANARNPFIAFMDDDIFLDPNCIERLWKCFHQNDNVGGVNALITNQCYHTPGKVTRAMYFLMHGKRLDSYAGKCIGPAWNILPEDREGMPDCVPVDWMNLGCTIYRMEALPTPPFKNHFVGYSMLEDLTLSLIVGRKWKLYNVPKAHIFHDSQPGSHKSNVKAVEKMELVNRHFIMVHIMGKKSILSHIKLFMFECFGVVTNLINTRDWKSAGKAVSGKFAAIATIISGNGK